MEFDDIIWRPKFGYIFDISDILSERADPVPGGSHLSGVLGKGLTEASLYPRKYAGRWRRTQDLVLSG
jgi:hypothetical protein